MERNTENRCNSCQQFYKISTVAERWDMSQKTIRRMVAAGLIRTKRIHGRIRISSTEVAKAIKEWDVNYRCGQAKNLIFIYWKDNIKWKRKIVLA